MWRRVMGSGPVVWCVHLRAVVRVIEQMLG